MHFAQENHYIYSVVELSDALSLRQLFFIAFLAQECSVPHKNNYIYSVLELEKVPLKNVEPASEVDSVIATKSAPREALPIL